MEPDGDSPPVWSPSTATILHHQRLRRRSSSPILSPVSLVLLLPILALAIVFFVVPPFLSHTTQILRPTYSVKKSWDSLNILLVAFAILCGVFARMNDDVSERADGGGAASEDISFPDYGKTEAAARLQTEAAAQVTRWFDAQVGFPEIGGRLRRSSSSYPDLREVPSWETGETRYRILDDFDVNSYTSRSDHLRRRARRSEVQKEESDVKVIPVDTFEVHSARPPSPDPPPNPTTPPPPPPEAANEKTRQSLHNVPRKRKVHKPELAEAELEEKRKAPPPPPPPPSSVEIEQYSEQRPQRKKSGTAKEIATALASLYTERKRKKKSKQGNSSGSSSESSPVTAYSSVSPPTPPPPPPPPPLPPSKAFQNLFKKGSKNNRINSVPATVPPPPPPQNSIFNNLFKTGSKSKAFLSSSSWAAPPPLPPPPSPTSSSILNNIFNQGSKSRRFKSESTAPPPPPPPPPPQQVSSKRKPKQTQHQLPASPPEAPLWRPPATRKPPLPAKTSTTYYEEYLNSGAQSPLIPLPPPPPPPFTMPELKFVARGDFVRILSAHSSPERPDLEDVEVMSAKSSSGTTAGPDTVGPSIFCPSPDVNLKADTFISRHKDKWRLDKMNSMNERTLQGRGPNLG